MPRISPFLVATTIVAGFSMGAAAQQALPTIGGGAGADGTAARERAATSAIEQQVEYRTSLQRDLAQREQLLRTGEKDLEARKQRLRATHQELLVTAHKLQEQTARLQAAEAAATAAPDPAAPDEEVAAAEDTPPPQQDEVDAVDPSAVRRLSKELEAQSYGIQVAGAQIKRLQQEVDYLRGVIAQMSGTRR